MYAQPLVYGSRVYVATENNTIYALDVVTGSVIWHQNVGTPVPDVSSSGCGNIGNVGITGTPVIDPATGRIYAVADTWDGSDPLTIHHRLVGFGLADGSPAPGLPIVVDAPGSQPRYHLQRPGLGLDAGRIVIGYGGYAGDCGPYNGWVVAAPESGSGPLYSFEVEQRSQHGAIWASGNAPAIDASGNVWVATGNGDGLVYAYQESVLKLSPTMALLDDWAPANWKTLDSGDTDLGSSAPLLLPGGLVFQIGKEGVGFLLAADHLGGEKAAPVYSAQVCPAAFGGAIYAGGVIYVACDNGMQALSVNTAARTFTPVAGWSAPSAATFAMFAAGRIWSGGGNTLYGLDPATGAVSFSQSIGTVAHFASPSAADGRLFIANTDQITAFTIAQPSPPSATSTALSASANPASAGAVVTYTATVSPAPDAGTVAFTDGGGAIAGCGTVAVSAGGAATCTTSYPAAVSHSVVAAYSGDAYYAASQSAPLTEVVSAGGGGPGGGGGGGGGGHRAVGPSLSRLRVRYSRRTLTVRFTLSEPATITIVVTRIRHGRVVKRVLLVHRHGKRGADTFRLKLRRLAAGRYTVTVRATDSGGRRSRTRKVSFVVRA